MVPYPALSSFPALRSRPVLLAAVAAMLVTSVAVAQQHSPAARAVGPLAPPGMPREGQYQTPDDMEAAARQLWEDGHHGRARRLTAVAQSYRQLGRPYLFGGTGRRSPAIDCSALVQWAYARAGYVLPRTSREQAQTGQPLPRTVSALDVGDLLFFGQRGITHVGIYLGGGYFVHASASLGRVAISSLRDPRWDTLWRDARRVAVEEDRAPVRTAGGGGITVRETARGGQ